MIDPNDVMKVSDEEWESFKEKAIQDDSYYHGKGDMMDTPEGRAQFCRQNKTGAYNKPDPENPGYKIWVFVVQNEGLVVKRRSKVDPRLMEDIEYNAEGVQLSKSYEPA